jgi:hypothetical protein
MRCITVGCEEGLTSTVPSAVLLRLGDLEGAMVAEIEEQAGQDAVAAMEAGEGEGEGE